MNKVNSRILSEITAFKKSKEITNAFIEVDEQNIRDIKVLILGNKDTPYECGFFVFNFHYPDQYPNIPIQVKFETTYGNRVRFNPNLYANGKVCLSLLNTWASNDWTPANNLSSVILSIQSLVMHDKPINNEPGYASNVSHIEVYNRFIRYLTLNMALWDNVCVANDPVLKRPFKELIKSLFTKELYSRALEILESEKKLGPLKFASADLRQYISMEPYIKEFLDSLANGSVYKTLEEKLRGLKKFVIEPEDSEEEQSSAAIVESNSERCEICFKGASELVEFNFLSKCESCSFMACDTCIKEWFNMIKKSTCPQCKTAFDKSHVVANPSTSTSSHYSHENWLISETYYKYVSEVGTKLSPIDSLLSMPYDSKIAALKSFVQTLKTGPVDNLIIYKEDSKDVVFNVKTGYWVLLSGSVGKKILLDHHQKIIYSKDGTQVLNKESKRWVSKDGPTGKKIIAAAQAATAPATTAPATITTN
jgi:ubiquitin-protein ligase